MMMIILIITIIIISYMQMRLMTIIIIRCFTDLILGEKRRKTRKDRAGDERARKAKGKRSLEPGAYLGFFPGGMIQ